MMLGFFLLKKQREPQEEFFRFCTFLVTQEDGQLLANNSYTGSIGLIQQNKAHIKTRADNVLMGDHFLLTNVCSSLVSLNRQSIKQLFKL